MMHFSSEIRAFSDSRETSYEIAQAISDLFPARMETVWAEPTDDEHRAVAARAFELADGDEDILFWGQERVTRDA